MKIKLNEQVGQMSLLLYVSDATKINLMKISILSFFLKLAESSMDMMENPTKNPRLFLHNLKQNFTNDGKTKVN